MNDVFIQTKTELATFLEQQILNLKPTRFPLDQKIIEHLAAFSTHGKMLRGVTVLHLTRLLKVDLEPTGAVRAAAALELFQSGLLIHDDIMDQDEKRRGLLSSFAWSREQAAQHQLHNSNWFGYSAAICIGDLAFFLAYELLTQAQLEESVKLDLFSLCNRELALLGLAQTQDLYLTNSASDQVTEEMIIEMYRGKTGRYTFGWPLGMAAILSQLPAETNLELQRIGENMGLLFQLKDDELGLFGDEAKTGKSSSNDIREGKKTLYWLYLRNQLSASSHSEQARLLSAFGDKNVSADQTKDIKSLLLELGIKAELEAKMQNLATEIHHDLDNLAIASEAKEFLIWMTDLIWQREK